MAKQQIMLPPIHPNMSAKIEPHLMKQSYKKVHVYLFDFNIMLGKGSFSNVYKGINLLSNQDVAVKVIDMNSITSQKLKQLLLQQIDILMKIKHQNLIKCFQVLSSSKNTYIIMELCAHDLGAVCEYMQKQEQNNNTKDDTTMQTKNLAVMYSNESDVRQKSQSILMKNNNPTNKSIKKSFLNSPSSVIPQEQSQQFITSNSFGTISSTKSVDFIQSSKDYSSQQIRFKQEKFYPFIKQIFQGIEYLVQNNIVHRDLKLSNIFLKDFKCKIGDFGFATKIPENQHQIRDTCCIGSPLYMSPQSYLQNVYNRKSDIWSFGILIFELIYGNPPLFSCPTHQILKCQIKKQINWSRYTSVAPISEQLMQVLQGCLQVQCRKRFDIKQLKQTKLIKWLLTSSPSFNRRQQFEGKKRIEQSRVNVYSEIKCDKTSQIFSKNQTSQIVTQYSNISIIPDKKYWEENHSKLKLPDYNNSKNANTNTNNNSMSNRLSYQYQGSFDTTDKNKQKYQQGKFQCSSPVKPYERKSTAKTNTLKHNNSCLALGQNSFNFNSFSDRTKSIQTKVVAKPQKSSFYQQNTEHSSKQKALQFKNTKPKSSFDRRNSKAFDRFLQIITPSQSSNEPDTKKTKPNQKNYRNSEESSSYLKNYSHMPFTQAQNSSNVSPTKQKPSAIDRFKSTDLNGNIFKQVNSYINKKQQSKLSQSDSDFEKYLKQRKTTQQLIQKSHPSSTDRLSQQIKVSLLNKSPAKLSTFSGSNQAKQQNSRDNKKFEQTNNRSSFKSYLNEISNKSVLIPSKDKGITSQKKKQQKLFPQKQENNFMTNASTAPNFYVPKRAHTSNSTDTNDKSESNRYEYKYLSDKKRNLQKHTSSPKLLSTPFDPASSGPEPYDRKAQKSMSNSYYYGQMGKNKQKNVKDSKQRDSTQKQNKSPMNLENKKSFQNSYKDKNLTTGDFLAQFNTRKNDIQVTSTLHKKSHWKGNANSNTNNKNTQTKQQQKQRFASKMDFSKQYIQQKTSAKVDKLIYSPIKHSNSYQESLSQLISKSLSYKQCIQMIHFSRLLYKISFNTQYHNQAVVILQYSQQILEKLLRLCNDLALKSGDDRVNQLNIYLLSLIQTTQMQCGKSIRHQLYANGSTKIKTNSSFLLSLQSSEMTLGQLSKKNQAIKGVVVEYLKKYRGRKQALIKLSAQSKPYSNLNRQLTTITQHKNFQKLQTVVDEIIRAKEQQQQKQSQNISNTYRKRISSQEICSSDYSISQIQIKFYLIISKFYIKSIEKTIVYPKSYKSIFQYIYEIFPTQSRNKSLIQTIFEKRSSLKNVQYGEFLMKYYSTLQNINNSSQGRKTEKTSINTLQSRVYC